MAARPVNDTLRALRTILAPLEERRIVEIGCGRGALLHALAGLGAKVAGIDPDQAALAEARKAAPTAILLQASAESLPFIDAAMHAAVFVNSLHHVPISGMTGALAEAARIVAPGGDVIVVEPLPEGTFFESMRPIEDETAVRLAAQQAIAKALRDGPLRLAECSEYDRVEIYPTLSAFIDRVVAVDPSRKDRALEERENVMKRFDIHAEPVKDGYLLRQPLRLHHLKVPG
ncbi:MAG TPA: class I SAM-dependent methyltransferase [Bosea sp. (in: a-proteobacteria)]|jgi:SAM-dependent methyltransferase|uniref:class I SAM-dependent methyltransferase n=1 Tax=Bosea sp. (in: a-proteobacteria) TaxID=1871050 RepID=UPI002E0E4883|nr:class I SAM-dependent methyltransferase [Bosea sp. (in: a-proteobacteria)]